MNFGYIKLYRSIQDHWLYTEKRKFSRFEAWNDILLTVNFSDSQTIIKGKVYYVKRGQSILSLDSWSKRWQWDKNAVRRFFNLLQKEQMIILVSDNITTQLTVCKYESYQGERNADETQKKRKRNAKDIQTTPIEEGEECKEGEELNNSNKLELLKNRKDQFIESLRNFSSKYDKEMLNDFFIYWTETDPKGKKMRFEMQSTWSIEGRLRFWNKNNFNFTKNGNTNNNKPNGTQQLQNSINNVLEQLGIEANSEEPKPNYENGTNDFTEFEVV